MVDPGIHHDAVKRDKLERILETAKVAPSGGDLQRAWPSILSRKHP